MRDGGTETLDDGLIFFVGVRNDTLKWLFVMKFTVLFVIFFLVQEETRANDNCMRCVKLFSSPFLNLVLALFFCILFPLVVVVVFVFYYSSCN